MKKLIVVYNPRSTKHQAVEREVLSPARKLKGWLVGKYEVTPEDVNANAKKLAKMLGSGDLVVAAGGDGTATVAVNGIMESGEDVMLGVLGYGNFNDMAAMLRTKRPVEYGDDYVGGLSDIMAKFEAWETTEIYPLEVLVNGKHWRYVPCYFTVGLFAESVAVFDEEKVRNKLNSGKKTPMFSWATLAKWYFKNHKSREFLPRFELNGAQMSEGTTDYVAMNGSRMAKAMKGKDWFLTPDKFGSATARLQSFWRLFGLMARSVIVKVPARDAERDVLKFAEPASVELHAEGEYERREGVSEIEVRKAGPVKAVRF